MRMSIDTIADEDQETRTIEMRLSHEWVYPLLEELLSFFAHLRHLLWRDLIIKLESLNAVKSRYVNAYGLTARQFNSLASETTAKKKSLSEIKKERLATLETSSLSLTKTIESLRKKLKDIDSSFKGIASYKEKARRRTSVRLGPFLYNFLELHPNYLI